MNVGGEGPTLVLDGHQVLGDHRKQNTERKPHFKSRQLKKTATEADLYVTGTKKKNNPKNDKWNLTAAPSPRSCPLLALAPVHLGSSARCAAASGRTAASS